MWFHDFPVQLKEAETVSMEVASVIRSICQENSLLVDYNGSSLHQISQYLIAEGCLGSERVVNSSDRWRGRRAAAPDVDTYSNQTVTQLIIACHILHVISVAILAVLVCEVQVKVLK